MLNERAPSVWILAIQQDREAVQEHKYSPERGKIEKMKDFLSEEVAQNVYERFLKVPNSSKNVLRCISEAPEILCHLKEDQIQALKIFAPNTQAS